MERESSNNISFINHLFLMMTVILVVRGVRSSTPTTGLFIMALFLPLLAGLGLTTRISKWRSKTLASRATVLAAAMFAIDIAAIVKVSQVGDKEFLPSWLLALACIYATLYTITHYGLVAVKVYILRRNKENICISAILAQMFELMFYRVVRIHGGQLYEQECEYLAELNISQNNLQEVMSALCTPGYAVWLAEKYDFDHKKVIDLMVEQELTNTNSEPCEIAGPEEDP